MRLKNEETSAPFVPDEQSITSATGLADQYALESLLRTQMDREVANRERLAQERAKLERFFTYRRQAADEKLASTQRVFERLSESDDPEVMRIIPVWAKNLETAKRVIANLESDADRRLNELTTHERVTSRHELIAVSYVEIVPEDGSR
jgi:hypothetical protein